MPSFNRMRELAELIRPGMGMGGLFRGRGGGGGQGDLVESGSYTVTVRIGDRELTRTLVVERVGMPLTMNDPRPTHDSGRRTWKSLRKLAAPTSVAEAGRGPTPLRSMA